MSAPKRFVYDPYVSTFQDRSHETYRILRDEHPNRRFVVTTRPCEATIDHPPHILLVELCKALDERTG